MAEAPDWQLLVARTATGEVVDALDVRTWRATDSLAWSGQRSLTLNRPLDNGRAGRISRTSMRALAAGRSRLSLCLARDGLALWAGPVVTVPWTVDSVQVTAAGLQWVFDRRVVCQPSQLADPAAAEADVTIDMPAPDRVVTLLQLGMTGARRGLPVSLPPLAGGEGERVVYTGGDLRTVHEAVKDIVEADGGPDVVVQPWLADDLGSIGWSVAVAPTVGADNPLAVWDFPLAAISGDIDESETVTRSWVQGGGIGGGTDRDTVRLGTWAADLSSADQADVVALERADRTAVSETRPVQLNALAASWGAQYRYGVEELTVSAPIDVGPQYRRDWQLGDTARFPVVGHPWLDDVEISARIVAVQLTPTRQEFTVVGARITPWTP